MSEATTDNRITHWRDERHLSVRALAELCGIDASTLNRLERGTQALDLPRMRRIAKALGVKASELLPDEDVEMRASEDGRAVLAQFENMPQADWPLLVGAARQVMHAAEILAARRSKLALAGTDGQVTELAEAWNSWDDARRSRALDLLRIANGE